MNETTTSRIEKLEIFKHDLEKKLIVAMTVASVLGITTIIGGGLISSLVRDLKELTVKTDRLDEKLKHWDSEVVNALSLLDKKETSIDINLKRRADESLSQLLIDFKKEVDLCQQVIDLSLERKKEEISNMGVNDVIKKLNNGSTKMVVKSLLIKNSTGNAAVYIAADSGGDGYFRLNSEKGEMRYDIRLTNNRPQSSFYNNSGVNVLKLGVFSDDGNGFARFYDQKKEKTRLELKGNAKGGVLSSYSSNGKQIVYLGPDSNSGNGLVNVMGLNGETTKSHAP